MILCKLCFSTEWWFRKPDHYLCLLCHVLHDSGWMAEPMALHTEECIHYHLSNLHEQNIASFHMQHSLAIIFKSKMSLYTIWMWQCTVLPLQTASYYSSILQEQLTFCECECMHTVYLLRGFEVKWTLLWYSRLSPRLSFASLKWPAASFLRKPSISMPCAMPKP